MGKSTSVKREIRFQQWIQQVKEYNERPDGMSMSAWCKTRGIAQSTFATRLQKVQDRCLESCQISAESSELSVSSEPAMPAFVELPVTKYSCEPSSPQWLGFLSLFQECDRPDIHRSHRFH